MKQLFYIIPVLLIVCSCNLSSSTKKPASDSLQAGSLFPDKFQQTDFRSDSLKIAAFIDSVLIHRSFNGSVLIAKNDKILFEKYSGLRDLRKKDSLTENTSLQLASTSKPFTAVAILKMIQDHQLSLEDSLTKFFPGLPYPGITIRMLLDHRSGLPNYVYFISESDWDKKKYVTNNDVLDQLYILQPRRTFPPDTRFSYSNTNYVLLALIIEKISGKSFPEYMKTNFFMPLQMDHTYVYTLADSASSTPSFNYNNRLWQNDFLELTYGDKNIYSTPRDLLKWSRALFSGKIINQSILDSAFAPFHSSKNKVNEIMPFTRNYGLGFRLLLMPDGKKVIYHFGRWHGFNAAFARLDDEKVTIIILGNKFDRNIYYTARQAYNIFGNYFPQQNVDEEETGGLNAKTEEPAKKDKLVKKPRHFKK
ncbi:MAG: serine hydrolase domain-containing protein [Chitinophagales bacterium]